MKNEEVFKLLKAKLKLAQNSIPFDLDELEPYYLESKSNLSYLCSHCIELKKLNLPSDCITKLDYCPIKDGDFNIVQLYESLLKIMNKPNFC